MVTLVWFILSLFDVCLFGWLPVFIDFLLATLMLIFKEGRHPILIRIYMGCALFSFLKCFLGLGLSGWWMLLFPIIFSLAALLPGGFTLFALLSKQIAVLSLHKWMLALCIVVDAFLLVFTLLDWAAEHKETNAVLDSSKSDMDMSPLRKIIVFVIIPLALLGATVTVSLFFKIAAYVGIALLLAYIKIILYCITHSRMYAFESTVFSSGMADWDMGEVNACLDIGDDQDSSLSFFEKVQRIKGAFLGSKHKKARVSKVQFTAVSPEKVEKDSYATFNIVMYEECSRGIVNKIVAAADRPQKESVGSTQAVSDNTAVTVKFISQDIGLEQTETQIWQGNFLNFIFCVKIPPTYEGKEILFNANVYFNNVIASRLKFTAYCGADDFARNANKTVTVSRKDVTSAFMSYASQDRSSVASLIMGMKKARPDMDIFFDVDNLRSGDQWEPVLYQEIEQRDVLFLCWSQNAKASEWVEKEWRHALNSKGIDGIEPIPLVPPDLCPPPDELSGKHFNDKFLMYTKR